MLEFYCDVDALDFAGPYEVFNLTTYKDSDVKRLFKNKLEDKPFKVSTVSHDGLQISVHNGLSVTPDFSCTICPEFDLVIIPGGPLKAIKAVGRNKAIINWIASHQNKLVASVCTGAFFVAKAGLLEGKKATTNRVALDFFATSFPNIEVIRDVKFVDAGNVITSGGISAGINMALYVVRKLFDEETSKRTARTIEFDY
ncbi:DJ-1/PfpI family protein [Bacillus sp. JCM 19034]|uniref:DJ-1/PfpI family protein n=1 Tax=Bacillus sp. JCM 19034 TaxID=1481928 RepID=UPI000B220C1D|nr:DJ-1/PfpI family protein [Bacillus sp. JCM 19034]